MNEISEQCHFLIYDLKSRPVATCRGTDTNPKERFIFHNAGLAGRGTSSYIDSVIMRDKNANVGWTVLSGDAPGGNDDTLEERRYYVQNWRADVVALLKGDGAVSEWIRYSAYGEATVYPFVNGDYEADGDVDGDDTIAFSAAWDSNANAADVDRANGVDGDDVIAFAAAWDAGYASTAWTAGGGLPAGAGQLSVTSGNRIGYAGYQFDPATEQYHVRHRVYSPEMGRWTRRDPLGYVDGMGLMEYVGGRAITHTDSKGRASLNVSVGTRLGFPQGATRRFPGITPPSDYPPGFYPPGVQGPGWNGEEWACQEACAVPPLPFMRTICVAGRPISCVCSPNNGLPNDPELSVFIEALLQCGFECEPRHWPNIDCPETFWPHGPYYVPPTQTPWRDKKCGKCCSEYDVNSCFADCVGRFKCETLPERYQEACRGAKEVLKGRATDLLQGCNACREGKPFDPLTCTAQAQQ